MHRNYLRSLESFHRLVLRYKPVKFACTIYEEIKNRFIDAVNIY